MNNEKSVYDALKSAGCEMGNHQSDLHVEDTPKARQILNAWGARFTPFNNEITGTTWLDVPFAYQPYWEMRRKPPTTSDSKSEA